MSAIISACGAYRYRLERECARGLTTAVIMVNPSTADADTDDATIRKLRGFGQRNGWGRIIVGNLFAYRSTNVKALGSASDPVGSDNDEHLRAIMADAGRVVFAWGPMSKLPKRLRTRWRTLSHMATAEGHEPLCIGNPARDGHPKHPLMLGYDSPFNQWMVPVL